MLGHLLQSGKVCQPMKVDDEGITPFSITIQANANAASFLLRDLLQDKIPGLVSSLRDFLIAEKLGGYDLLVRFLKEDPPRPKSIVMRLLVADDLLGFWRKLERLLYESRDNPVKWAPENGQVDLDEVLAEVGELPEDAWRHGSRIATSNFQVFVDGKWFHRGRPWDDKSGVITMRPIGKARYESEIRPNMGRGGDLSLFKSTLISIMSGSDSHRRVRHGG